jgi:hypothetical protein
MLNTGSSGCRDTLPHLQRLAVHAGEALDELEKLASALVRRPLQLHYRPERD